MAGQLALCGGAGKGADIPTGCVFLPKEVDLLHEDIFLEQGKVPRRGQGRGRLLGSGLWLSVANLTESFHQSRMLTLQLALR